MYSWYAMPLGQGGSDSDSDDSDIDIDYVSIVQELITGYRNGSLLSSFYHGIDNNPMSAPRIRSRPNTSRLLKSEFALSTRMSSGSGMLKRKWGRNNVANMILAREKGIPFFNGFSYADRCKVSNKFLPNDMEVIQRRMGKVFCGIFSKDGDYFMTASQDHRINIFDAKYATYKPLNEIVAQEVEWSIIDVAFSPNREQFVYSTWNTALQLVSIHDTSNKQEMLRLTTEGNRFCAFSVGFSMNGAEVLAAANDGCIYIYDLERRMRTFRILAHEFDVNTIALASESSQIIYSGGDDGVIKVWDRRTLNERTPKPVGRLAGHLDGITYIDSRGDDRHLISNSKDQSIKLWDIRAFSSSSVADRTKKIVQQQPWDYRWQNVPRKMYAEKKVEGDTSLMTYKGHVVVKTLVRCRFSPVATTGQRYIYTGCGLGRVVIYDALTGKIKRQLAGHNAIVRDVSWHPCKNEILTSSWDGLVGRWRYLPLENFENDEDDLDKCQNETPQNLRRSKRLAEKHKRELAVQ